MKSLIWIIYLSNIWNIECGLTLVDKYVKKGNGNQHRWLQGAYNNNEIYPQDTRTDFDTMYG